MSSDFDRLIDHYKRLLDKEGIEIIPKEKTHGKFRVNVLCIKCNRNGSLLIKQTWSKGKPYRYYYVEHHIGNKIKWCYLGKYERLPDDYKQLIDRDTQKDTQTDTQSKVEPNNLKSSLIHQNITEKGSASIAQRLERQPCKL
jgi:hypothetical protein